MVNYNMTCSDERIAGIYNAIRADGVPDKELDTGYSLVERVGDKLKKKTIGAGDLNITCEEILEYAVDNYQTYQHLLKGLAGREVPWLFDEKTTAKISAVIERIKDGLSKDGITPGTKVYKKKMAVALYYYAYVPDAKVMRYWKENAPYKLANMMKPLEVLFGMGDFADWLIENGGLGLLKYKMDIEPEGTALEALEKQRGLCTEKAKIFYSILRMAGFSPYFAVTTAKDLYREINKLNFGGGNIFRLGPEEEFWGHAVTAVNLDGEEMFFEFQFGEVPVWDAPYEDIALPLSLREFYQVDMLNLSWSHYNTGNLDKRKEAWAGADVLGDSAVKSAILSHAATIVLQNNETSGDLFIMPPFLKLAASNIASAAKFLNKALKIDPSDVFAKSLYCYTLLQGDKREEAIDCYRDISSRASDANYKLGIALFGADRPVEARDAFLKAEKNGINLPETYNWIGRTYLAEENFGAAEVYFRKAVGKTPFNAEYNINLSSALAGAGKIEEAVAFLKKALILDPVNIDSYSSLFILLASQKKTEEAVGIAEMMEGVFPKDKAMAFRFIRGSLLAEMGETDKAVSCFRVVYDEGSEQLKQQAAFKLGMLLEAKGDYAGAVEAFNLLAVSGAADDEVYMHLAGALWRTGRHDEAVSALGRAFLVPLKRLEALFKEKGAEAFSVAVMNETLARVLPQEMFEDEDVRKIFCDYFGKIGFALNGMDYQKAITALKTAIDYDETDINAHYFLAEVYFSSGDYAGAADEYGIVAGLFMLRDRMVYIDSGARWLVSLWKAGMDISPALDYLKKFLLLKLPSDPTEIAEGAFEHFDELPRELIAGSDDVAGLLIKLYSRFGGRLFAGRYYDAAKGCYERILKLDPAHKEAKDMLKKIKAAE